MGSLKKFKRNLNPVVEIVLLAFALVVFCYSGYKIASYYGLFPKKVLGTGCCCPTPTCSCPEPTPTQPTPTEGQPTPTEVSPTPTSEVPTPTPTNTPSSGDSGGGSDGRGGPPGPPVCGDSAPPSPYLKELRMLGGGKVELLWDPVDPTTHYNISYGPSSGNYTYGVDNTGKVTSFIIGGLGGGNYCFTVRGVNNCMPGGPSNEKCTSGAVLGTSNEKILGASVLGATGGFADQFSYLIFTVGCLFSGIGIRLTFAKRKLV